MYAKMIEENIPHKIKVILKSMGILGKENNIKTYVVGGFVRDLILGVPNYDVDIVIEGEGIEFGKKIARMFHLPYVKHKEFNTCTLFLKDFDIDKLEKYIGTKNEIITHDMIISEIDITEEGAFRLDISTARTETYHSPAVLPKVTSSGIEDDLFRRDFTINSMAISLNPEDYGELLDFFDCRKDLEKGLIKCLHPVSFIDDPTRIIRGVRFEQRYGFRIEKNTLGFMKEAVEDNNIENLSGMRLREELDKVLKEPKPLKALRRLHELETIPHIFKGTHYTDETDKILKKFFDKKKQYEKKLPFIISEIRLLHIIFYAIMLDTPEEFLKDIIQRYALPKKFFSNISDLKSSYDKINHFYNLNNSEFYEYTKKLDNECTLMLLSMINDELHESYIHYLTEYHNIEIYTNGDKLIEIGITDGFRIKEILEDVKKKRLDGLLTYEEEKDYIQTKK